MKKILALTLFFVLCSARHRSADGIDLPEDGTSFIISSPLTGETISRMKGGIVLKNGN